jgi:branched-chain amino acid aminotransferase
VTAALAAAADAGRREASVRVSVTRGVGPPGVAPPPSATPTVVVAVHGPPAFPPSTYTAGLTVRIASGRRNEHAMTAGLKTLAYTDAIVALAAARAAGADDALFLDTDGHLSEASASNVLLVTDGRLATPPASCGALPGITRAAVLECARALGIPTEERPLAPDDLDLADEALLTSTVREVVPLVAIIGADGTRAPIGRGEPGEVTRRLMAAYTELVRRETGS